MAIQNLNLASYMGKTDGVDTLSASMWNTLMQSLQSKSNEIIQAVNSGTGVSSNDTPTFESKFYVNGVETTPTDGVVTLAANAKYVLKGTLEGCVSVSGTTPTDDTHIVLDNVKIVCSKTNNKGITYEALSQSLQVTLSPNSVNIIECTNVAEMAEQQGACLYSENNMILQGNGYLSVKNKGGHGIKASELRISGNPHIFADTIHDGIHGNSSLVVDGGVFYITNSNDAFGTGSTGSIKMFGGTCYVYGIKQNCFDSKEQGYIYGDISLNTDVESDKLFSGIKYADYNVLFGNAVQDTTNGGYSTQASGTVKCYSDEALTLDESVITALSGVYTLTTKYAVIEGCIEGNVTTNIQSTNIELRNAVVKGDILYTATKKKIQINVEKDKIGIVNNISSGSNLSLEIKGGGHLLINGDVSGDELTFNDSKGVCIIHGNVTGKDIYIATAATPDATKYLQGAFIIEGTINAINNSKFTKGWIHVLDSNMLGVFCADTVNVKGYADFDGCNKVFYHKSIGAVIGNKCIEDKEYISI